MDMQKQYKGNYDNGNAAGENGQERPKDWEGRGVVRTKITVATAPIMATIVMPTAATTLNAVGKRSMSSCCLVASSVPLGK
ncbi:MAG: hypothetical protein LBT98_02005 [Puniceicoccales bacterium]|jgi:hypothetical protein|nr:hypothetical protein [Puniceicoccales bacterium]